MFDWLFALVAWFGELPALSQAIIAYLLFLLVFLAWLIYEIKKSPVYLDENMTQRAPPDPPKTKVTVTGEVVKTP